MSIGRGRFKRPANSHPWEIAIITSLVLVVVLIVATF